MSSNVVGFGIPALALLVAALFVVGIARAESTLDSPANLRRRRILLATFLTFDFMAALAALAATGVLARFDRFPPPLMPTMAAALVLSFVVGTSPIGGRLARGLPLAALVGTQAFRLPLELVMHEAARAKIMPNVMSFTGYNFDIVSGITAAALGLALARGVRVPLGVIAAWNVLGSALLAGIIVIAILATPLFRAFGDDQLNVWVTEFPYVWIIVCVAGALVGHIVVTRRLLAEIKSRNHPVALGGVAAPQ